MYRRSLLTVLMTLILAGCYGGSDYYERDVYTQPVYGTGYGSAYVYDSYRPYYYRSGVYVTPRYYSPGPRYYSPPRYYVPPRYYQGPRPGYGGPRPGYGGPGWQGGPRPGSGYHPGPRPGWSDNHGGGGHGPGGPGRGGPGGGRGGGRGGGGHR